MDSTARELNERAIAAYNSGRIDEAVRRWEAALADDPEDWEIMVYLASAMKELGHLEASGDRYVQALAIQPALPEAHYNLGNIRQLQGRLDEAAECFRNALDHKPDFAYALYNLGNILRDQGMLDAAIAHYKQAIIAAPEHAPSYNNLGNALKHRGNLEQAIQCYHAALQNQPDYAEARYNLGNAHFEQGEFAAALPWFESAAIRDAEARALYCEYKCEQFEQFAARLQRHLRTAPHHSPQVATLTAHHAINTGGDDAYRFCPRPFDLVYHEAVPEIAESAALRRNLLDTIAAAGIDERVQGRLHNGVQSSGNLFQREEPAFRELAELVLQHFRQYHQRYALERCELIEAFPQELVFESAWYIRMRRGGHLAAHIHEGGWVSGVLYLALPEPRQSPDEGCLELGLHGDDYPLRTDAAQFPRRLVQIRTGDIVLFPANLFHRTLPFTSDEERICVAFDLRPAAGVR